MEKRENTFSKSKYRQARQRTHVITRGKKRVIPKTRRRRSENGMPLRRADYLQEEQQKYPTREGCKNGWSFDLGEKKCKKEGNREDGKSACKEEQDHVHLEQDYDLKKMQNEEGERCIGDGGVETEKHN